MEHSVSTPSTKKFLWARLALALVLFFLSFALGDYYGSNRNLPDPDYEKPLAIDTTIRDLIRYSIPNLSNSQIKPGSLLIENEPFFTDDDYSSYYFQFTFRPDPKNDSTKMTTGQINIPNSSPDRLDQFPVVLMFRGYVDQEEYATGVGTKNAAAYFAQNGYLTIAPDFLGYAQSDKEAENIFEARFQTYTTATSLLETIISIPQNIGLVDGPTDVTTKITNQLKLFIWGHSNGGQIALTTLVITGSNNPTTLWAPVSAPFPYSVLFYTIDSNDGGKLIRNELYKIENLMDTKLFSTANYLDQIQAPIQLHQGTNDDAVPFEWSDSLNEALIELEIPINYFKYPGADHNLRPDWDTVVKRDLEFFNSYLKS